jgi:hypothetical protein
MGARATIAREDLRALLHGADPDEGTVLHGWRTDGAGPARFGWWWQAPTGLCRWLGRTQLDVRWRAAEQQATAEETPR